MARKSVAPKTAPGDSVTALVALLDLEQLELNLFRGVSPSGGWRRVYGGQVLAQALVAASRTVAPERIIHSLHGYFLLGGDPSIPIIYSVERLRDGGSFTTRRVTAIQAGRPIFELSSSFHKSEEGFAHASAPPDVPPPDQVATIQELMSRPDAQIRDTMRAYFSQDRPIELRVIDPRRYLGHEKLPAQQAFWLKAKTRLPDDPVLHRALLAYASDFAMIDTALIAHGRVMFDPHLQLASLDHALWMHRDARADQWLLYVLDSPVAGAGRGFTRGTFFTENGSLVASVAQEGLMRQKSTDFVIT